MMSAVVPTSPNLTRVRSQVSAGERAQLLDQRGAVIWLTGLSGAGKSTIAYALERSLLTANKLAYVLDGDNLRHGVCADLGFSAADRAENQRRTSEIAALFADAGLLVITALISPSRAARAAARDRCPAGGFIEVFLDVPLAVCEQRDPKSLYARARAGELPGFTGIDAPYEAPETAELTLDTSALAVEACVAQIERYLADHGFFAGASGARA